MKFLNGIDLGQNELLNAVLQNLSSDPGSPEAGQIWYNTSTNKFKVFNGTTAIDFLARANHTGTQAWSTISGTPTTLTGYGITDAALSSDLSTKANLASPTFTGTPSAPTATAGTNTGQVATTAFVRGEVSALIDSAPGTLDTLNEIAAALGDDPNFATTLTNSIALKAPLASPALTGTPTAPTPTPGDNTTKVATTAFVTTALAGAGGALKYAANIGDGSSATIVVTHNLGTRDVVVSLREVASPYAAAITDWEATTANSVTFFFGVGSEPAVDELRAVIVA